MEMNTPQTGPYTATVRRNPHRRARPRTIPSSDAAVPSSSSKAASNIRPFPFQDILSIEIPQTENPKQTEPISSKSSSPPKTLVSENLKVFLRVRPNLRTAGSLKNSRKKDPPKSGIASKKKTKGVICLRVNEDLHSITLSPPQSLQDARRIKSEVYEGFSHVFCAESSQTEVYERMVNPLVEDFLKGKSGMLAALGPSGSGKTHTVFGSVREPGMVPLALRHIFSPSTSKGAECSRTFYLSMFEIYSERGKGEKILDLSEAGVDLCMQQSKIRGLQEVVIHDAEQAESLIASGMLKRSTAMTNSNIQSSRSQCIINIRSGPGTIGEGADVESCSALLTVVDLAGAERERRTGNQGARLLESNFINNTSMVFGLCLRSLLEHQKNPKKPLQKHFQNSLLTKYLRDYLEGKKRMTLILTAKSGEEDYHDTSFLLRQASPFMDIKFENIGDQPSNAFAKKRQLQTFPKVEQPKKIKFSNVEVRMDGEGKGGVLNQLNEEELNLEQLRGVETVIITAQCPRVTDEVNDTAFIKPYVTDLAKRDREYKVLLNFARAFWNILKEYKNKLEASENEVLSLRASLTLEKERCAALENDMNIMKASCSCGKEDVAEMSPIQTSGFRTNSLSELEGCQYPYVHELDAQVSSSHSIQSACFKSMRTSDDIVCSSGATNSDCFDAINIRNQNFMVKLVSEVHGQVLSASLCESECVDNMLASDSRRAPSVEVISEYVIVEDFEEHGNEKDDISCGIVGCQKGLKELEEIEDSRETAGCDPLESVISCLESDAVHRDEISSSAEGEPPAQEKKEGTTDPQLTLPEDVSSSRGSNASKPPKVEFSPQPCQSCNAVKPKRRLQPASTVLLRNINSLDLNDANDKPKGTRGEKKASADITNRTQGSMSLLRLLKGNLHL